MSNSTEKSKITVLDCQGNILRTIKNAILYDENGRFCIENGVRRTVFYGTHAEWTCVDTSVQNSIKRFSIKYITTAGKTCTRKFFDEGDARVFADRRLNDGCKKVEFCEA